MSIEVWQHPGAPFDAMLYGIAAVTYAIMQGMKL